jgi:hypothetical protein
LNAAAAGREVPRDRELERAAVGQVDHALNAALSEGALAHDERAMVILQRAREDLCRARAVPVDEHDDGKLRSRPRRPRPRFVLRLPVAPAGRDDHALAQELIGDEHGFVQQSAGVEAQVQHQSAQPPARGARE